MKNHFTLFIFAFLVTLLTLGIYVYMYLTVDLSLAKIAKNQSLVNSSKLTSSREANFIEVYEKTAAKWQKMRNLFVESDKVVNFIETIEALDSESGAKVSIASIDADNLDNAPADKIGYLRLRINAQGSWSSVMKALVLTENLPYKVTINNIQANRSDISNGKNTSSNYWNLSFGLQVAMISSTSTVVTSK